MAFRDDLYTGDIQKRVNDIKDLPGDQRWINKYDLDYMNHIFGNALEDDLGIVVELDGTVRNYTPEVPRIFIMKKDADGTDTMMDLKTAGIERGSIDFWKQVQLGNVFAYPAGDTLPVQLKVDTKKGSDPKLSFSKPVTPDTLPPAPQPKKPGFFTRIGAFFSSRLQEQCQKYDNWMADRRINFNNLSLQSSKRKNSEKLATETSEMKRILGLKKEKRLNKANKAVRDDILEKEKRGQSKEEGLNNAISMYQPVPETRPNLLTDSTNIKFYTKEQFDTLEKYTDLDLSKINIGGKGLDNKEFAALAMTASMKTEYTLKNPLLRKQGGSSKSVILQNELGMSKADADYVTGCSFDGVLSRDLMDMGNERMTNGEAIETMAVPGRRDVKDALVKIRPDDPESKRDLAKIIAFGIKRAAHSLSTQEGKLQDRVHNYFHMNGKMADLLDRDPDLMRLAKEEGMSMQAYKAVKGMAELDRLDTKRKAAQKTLYTAAVGDRPLDDNVKKAAIKDILKANLAESTIIAEVGKADPDPRALEAYMKLQAKEYNPPAAKDYKTAEQHHAAMQEYLKIEKQGKLKGEPYAPGGKVWHGTPSTIMINLKELYSQPPKTAVGLSSETGREQLDKMVEKIIEKDGLMSLGTADLGIKMSSDSYTGSSLIKKGDLAAEAIKNEQKAPANENVQELNTNKKDGGHHPPSFLTISDSQGNPG